MSKAIRRLRMADVFINLLRMATQIMTYKEVAKLLGESPPIISRYKSGQVIPWKRELPEMCMKLWEAVKGRVEPTPFLMALGALKQVAGTIIDYIVTVPGTPGEVATLMSYWLDIPLIWARHRVMVEGESVSMDYVVPIPMPKKPHRPRRVTIVAEDGFQAKCILLSLPRMVEARPILTIDTLREIELIDAVIIEVAHI